MGERAWEDEYTLLCERCGYVIEGLPHEGACPECGKAIAESLPERRVGTPWQRGPSMVSLFATAWFTVRHPYGTLDVMRAGEAANRRLRFAYNASAGGLVGLGVLAWVVPMIFIPFVPGDKQSPETAAWHVAFAGIACLLIAVVAYLMFEVFTEIETRGVRFFAARRGFRLTPAMAQAVGAHGSVGWVIAGVGAPLSALYVPFALEYAPEESIMMVLGGLGLGGAGFLFFEAFAYLGLRRCKFANRGRPSGAADAGVEAARDES